VNVRYRPNPPAACEALMDMDGFLTKLACEAVGRQTMEEIVGSDQSAGGLEFDLDIRVNGHSIPAERFINAAIVHIRAEEESI
jgi:hypothetical protein